jgi:hypothetical protein
MNMVMRIFITTFYLLLLCGHNILFSQTSEWHGQLSGWLTGKPDNSLISQVGVRYIPDISIEKSLASDLQINMEISFNTYTAGNFHSWRNTNADAKLKPYRIWLRFSTSRFEARLGLQKINFGPAILFRPLMWFDRIDPRDPLQLTDGVYALLSRYYFQNNTNIWLWGLYGNNKTKGWEIIPTEKNSIEYGSRTQLPLFKGEIGFSYHYRQIDFKQAAQMLYPIKDSTSVSENRYGLDGKWDIGVGLWFEGVLIHKQTKTSQMKYQRLWTTGIDYTFKLGNGLYALCEYFNTASNDKSYLRGKGISFTALLINYPLGLLDYLSGILYYQMDNGTLYRLINWQRQYDNWSFYLILFWNPGRGSLNPNQTGNTIYSGNGFQCMVVFNH